MNTNLTVFGILLSGCLFVPACQKPATNEQPRTAKQESEAKPTASPAAEASKPAQIDATATKAEQGADAAANTAAPDTAAATTSAPPKAAADCVPQFDDPEKLAQHLTSPAAYRSLRDDAEKAWGGFCMGLQSANGPGGAVLNATRTSGSWRDMQLSYSGSNEANERKIYEFYLMSTPEAAKAGLADKLDAALLKLLGKKQRWGNGKGDWLLGTEAKKDGVWEQVLHVRRVDDGVEIRFQELAPGEAEEGE